MPVNKIGNTKKQQAGMKTSTLLWYGIGAALVIFGAVAYFVSRRTAIPFEMNDGNHNPVVLLRNDSTVYYELTYTGSSPAQLERIIPRIQLFQDQVLVADVQGVLVRVNGEEIQLADGYFPEGEPLVLNQGDVFEVGVTYIGQELGWNRIYGWRLQYTQEGRQVDGELELKDNYYVFVE